MRRRILPLLIAIGLTMSVNMSTLAAPLGSYNTVQKNLDKLEMSIETLDSNIENVYSGIDKAKYEISDTQKKIDQTTKDILVSQNNIKKEEVIFNERMRAMYMNGADSYVEIILDSEGVEDLISRVDNVKKIVEYDNKIIKQLKEEKQAIEVRKKSLNDNKIKVLALKAANENKLDKLTAQKKEQSQLIVEAKKQQEIHKNDVAIATKQVTPSRGQVVRDVVKSDTSQQSSVPQQSSSASSNAIISYAKTFLGTPYVWGANGPNTFDCSGFTKYVFAHFEISMGRTTYDQIAQGQYVARENLQAGDLVFFGSGSPHHVGIYMGNGSYIHAPHTGDVVKISQLTRTDYMSARRFK